MRISKVREERGQAMVEFVLVFPILLLLIMACMEFGWYFASRYSLGQYSREVGYNVNEPFSLVWYHLSAPRNWVDESSGRKPSWLSDREKQSWSFEEYDGWFAFSDPGPTDIIGRNYYYYGFDSEIWFKDRLNLINTILDDNEITYQLRGGWYIKAEARDMPRGGGSDGTEKRVTERSEYYYADVTVDITYKYYPLTFVGKMIFCNPGEDYTILKDKGRYTYALAPGLLS